jgi:RimJ/RimL family protein N-acetyltransferase
MFTNGLWMNALRVPGASYKAIFQQLLSYGIDTRPMFYPIGKHEHLRTISATSSEIDHDEVFMIPSSPTLTCYDQVYIAHSIRSILDGRNPPNVSRIDENNIHLLEKFIQCEHPETFRYFKTRTSDVCVKHHTLTLVATQGDTPIGYAHLDDRWIGLCILPEYQHRGYGSFLLTLVLDTAMLMGISEVRLTVDKTNDIASNLYIRHGFSIEEVKDT